MGLADRVDGLQVSLDNMSDAARWVDAVRADWDQEVLGRYRGQVEPLRDGQDGHAAAQVPGWDNPFGRFGEADTVHTDVRASHDLLHDRMTRVSQLLQRLGEITGEIGDNYDATELRNAAVQRRVAELLDDPVFGVTT
ncbi:MAG TPA: hypothetical protein VGN37_10625 [Actinocatenispora sp.]